MDKQSTIDCPSCKMPILNVSPITERGYDGMVCPFCGADVSAVKADNLDEGLLIGWRGLTIKYGPDGDPTIHSPVYPLEWKPGETVVATCGGGPIESCRHRAEGDKAPALNPDGTPACSCGFYAARTRDHILDLGYGRNPDPFEPTSVVTEVVQFGRVVVCHLGWRAEKCRIRRIYVPHVAWKVAKRLEEKFGPHGVEVVLGDNDNLPREMIPEWCGKCGAKMKGRDLTCGFCGQVNKPLST